MQKSQIEEFVKENKTEQLTMLRKLCEIPAPSHYEDERAEYCKEWLQKNGAHGVYIDDAKNTVFPYCCEGSNHITVICAHTDTVFPDRVKMPFEDDGEILRCPGIGDDTASVVALLLTAKFFQNAEIEPKGGILFVCNSCEEGLGNLKGIRQIFRDYQGRIKQFISFDSSNINSVADHCVGSRRYCVTVETEGGHSFSRFGNENAIFRLSEIIHKIYSIKVPVIDDSKTTYNVGMISGGTSVNTIAQRAEMLCEYRSDNEKCLLVMQKEFEKIFNESKKNNIKVTYEVVGERPCESGVSKKEIDRLKSICEDVVGEVTGETVIFKSSSTDCNIPLSLGIPAICVGVYNGGGTHTREEWLEKKSLPYGLKVAVLYALKLIGEDVSE